MKKGICTCSQFFVYYLAYFTVQASEGDKFVWKDVWGEQMTTKQKTVLCVLDIESGVASVLENIPSNVSAGKVNIS